MEITTLLLAGGQSKRLGYDKRLLEFQGKTLIRRAFEATQAISNEVWVLVASQQDEQLLSPLIGDVRFVFDSDPNSGPLGALMNALSRVRRGYALLLAVDYPLITGEFLQRMKSALETETILPEVFVPFWEEMPQVTCAFYKSCLSKELQEAFARGERSLRRWVMRLSQNRVRWLLEEEFKKWADDGVFLNVNTPPDYERLMQLAQSSFEK